MSDISNLAARSTLNSNETSNAVQTFRVTIKTRKRRRGLRLREKQERETVYRNRPKFAERTKDFQEFFMEVCNVGQRRIEIGIVVQQHF